MTKILKNPMETVINRPTIKSESETEFKWEAWPQRSEWGERPRRGERGGTASTG